MFRELLERLLSKPSDQKVNEWLGVSAPALSAEEKLAYPDPRPCAFDANTEAWLVRIGSWGRLRFKYRDTHLSNRWYDVSRREFVKKLMDPDMLHMFGQFMVDWQDVNKVLLYREFQGLDGGTYKEEFQVVIDLKPKLKALLKRR